MSFHIYQLEKSQALDLLDRVQEYLNRYLETPHNEDESITDSCRAVTKAYHEVNEKRTELQQHEFNLDLIAGAMNDFHFSNVNRTMQADEVVAWFARYFSNYAVSTTSFMLAAGFPLHDSDKLLFEPASKDGIQDEIDWAEDRY